LLRVLGGVTKHLVTLESFPRSATPKKVTASLAADGRDWAEQLGSLIDELLPPEPPLERPPHLAIEPKIAEPPGWWGPALIIVGGVTMLTAAILAERASHTRMKLVHGTVSPEEFERIDRRRDDLSISSLVLFGIGGLLGGGGVIFVLLDW
jgi:hypothetical protein